MIKIKNLGKRRKEKGNVLFLILIAVALFAALSYAVTQSTRSGSGDANKETNLISSAQITQYPAAIRTSIIRMVVSENLDVTSLAFDVPPFTACAGADLDRCVFHPSAGGATFAQAPPDVMADGLPGDWAFNGDFEIENLGVSSDTSTDGNDIIAFLPGLKESICTKLNEELGFGTTPVIAASIAGADPGTPGYLRMMDVGLGMESGATDIELGTNGEAGSNIANFDGQAFGCFQNTAGGDFVYYHVLVER